MWYTRKFYIYSVPLENGERVTLREHSFSRVNNVYVVDSFHATNGGNIPRN